MKIDAVPGRLNETWFRAEQEGVYFGQCSELCGKNHSYMPITVKVVSQEAYDAWLNWAIDEYGGTRPEAAAPGGAAAAPSAAAPRRPPPSRAGSPPSRPQPRRPSPPQPPADRAGGAGRAAPASRSGRAAAAPAGGGARTRSAAPAN